MSDFEELDREMGRVLSPKEFRNFSEGEDVGLGAFVAVLRSSGEVQVGMVFMKRDSRSRPGQITYTVLFDPRSDLSRTCSREEIYFIYELTKLAERR